MILKDKVIENNILNCTLEINGDKINIKNFDLSKDFLKTRKYYIYIKQIGNEIHFDVKPIISVFFSLFNMYNIRKCLENSKYIKVVENENDADILFTKPTLTYDYPKKNKQWQNFNKDVRNICHKKNLNELVKDTKKYVREYFNKISVQSLLNKNVHVTKHRDTDEKIIICKKKN